MGVARGRLLLCMLSRSNQGRSPPGCPVAIHAVSLKKDARWPKVAAALTIFAHPVIVRLIHCTLPSVPPFYLALVVEGPVGRCWVGAGRNSLVPVLLPFLYLPGSLMHVV